MTDFVCVFSTGRSNIRFETKKVWRLLSRWTEVTAGPGRGGRSSREPDERWPRRFPNPHVASTTKAWCSISRSIWKAGGICRSIFVWCQSCNYLREDTGISGHLRWDVLIVAVGDPTRPRDARRGDRSRDPSCPTSLSSFPNFSRAMQLQGYLCNNLPNVMLKWVHVGRSSFFSSTKWTIFFYNITIFEKVTSPDHYYLSLVRIFRYILLKIGITGLVCFLELRTVKGTLAMLKSFHISG
jgi:hypothetical protein